MMSSNELHAYRNKEYTKTAKQIFADLGGQKLNYCLPTNIYREEEAAHVERLKEIWFDRLKFKKVGRQGDLCKIIYDRSEKSLVFEKKTKLSRHMGYTRPSGITLAYPEEALFLMDSAAAEIYCDGIPIGFREALGEFSRHFTLTVAQYLVYANLVRAGFVVRRFSSPAASANKSADAPSRLTGDKRINDNAEISPPPKKAAKAYSGRESLPPVAPDRSDATGGCPAVSWFAPSRWDFRRIRVPDDRGGSRMHLTDPPPDPAFLPVALQQATLSRSAISYANFSSRPSWNRGRRDANENWRRRKRDFYRTANSLHLDVGRIDSWRRFKAEKAKLLQRCSNDRPRATSTKRVESGGDSLQVLVDVAGRTAADVLKRLDIVTGRSTIMSNEHSATRADGSKDELRVTFNVYLSDPGFTLSNPPKPLYHLVILSVKDPPPTAHKIDNLSRSLSDSVPIKFAVVDNSEILYFEFENVVTSQLY